MSYQQAHTLPCPECQSPIPVSMQRLLSGQSLDCLNPHCEVELRIDTQKSQKALDQVRTLQTAVQQFEAKQENIGA